MARSADDAGGATPPIGGMEGTDLTTFDRLALHVVADEPRHGQAIKRALAEYYGEEPSHGRLYPALDRLADAGYIDKGKRDERTNEYAITDAGLDVIVEDLRWRAAWLEAADEDVDLDVDADLVEEVDSDSEESTEADLQQESDDDDVPVDAILAGEEPPEDYRTVELRQVVADAVSVPEFESDMFRVADHRAIVQTIGSLPESEARKATVGDLKELYDALLPGGYEAPDQQTVYLRKPDLVGVIEVLPTDDVEDETDDGIDGDSDHEVGAELPDDVDEDSADESADAGHLPFDLPDGWTVADLEDLADEHEYISTVADELGMSDGQVRADLVALGKYDSMREGVRYGD